MSDKPTIGPWVYGVGQVTQLDGSHLAVGRLQSEHGGEWVPVALLSPYALVNETDMANARLIAAAPDLLEALKLVRASLPADFDAITETAALAAFIAVEILQIDTAIAKATGQEGGAA